MDFESEIQCPPLETHLGFNENIVSALPVSETGVQVSLTTSPVTTATVAVNTQAITVAPGTAASIAIQANRVRYF